MIFLIRYNRTNGSLVTLERFEQADRTAASAARLKLEVALYREGTPHEVVLLEAATEADLKRTHARYFKNAHQIASIEVSKLEAEEKGSGKARRKA